MQIRVPQVIYVLGDEPVIMNTSRPIYWPYQGMEDLVEWGKKGEIDRTAR
jgi:hypothetical protein